MMGGGFGGCTINLLRKEYANEFIEQISKAYYNQFQIQLEAYPVDIADGASVLEKQTI
jgi:galactokinase